MSPFLPTNMSWQLRNYLGPKRTLILKSTLTNTLLSSQYPSHVPLKHNNYAIIIILCYYIILHII